MVLVAHTTATAKDEASKAFIALTIRSKETRMAFIKTRQERPANDLMKEERARDAARAMQEYKAEGLALAARTARLRALRLAKEASDPPKKAGRVRGR
jgi:hypothetical protein